MKFYINIEYQNSFFTLFVLGYTSDGGFFVKDLINDGGEFLIIKFSIPPEAMREFGEHKIREENIDFWKSSKSPKITHHIDGNVHISGAGIMSGFYDFFNKPKGVFSKGMNLNERDNDGGPLFVFGVQNLPRTKCMTKNSVLIKNSDQFLDPCYGPKNKEDGAFVLEFFYLPKSAVSKIDLKRGTILFRHINYGVVNLKYIPAPSKSPGFIAILPKIIAKEDESKSFSFSLHGGTTKLLPSGFHEQISIVYPRRKELTKGSKVKNLDFNFLNRLKVKIDSFLNQFDK